MRNKYGYFDYISIVEPQGRGAWHCHVIVIFESKAPFMNQKTIESDIWRKGSVKATNLTAIDNLGAYLTAYLGNIPIHHVKRSDRGDFEVIDVKGKKYLKGARLSMYPAKMNILRRSKNIKKPQVSYTSDFHEIERCTQGKMTFSKVYSIQSESKEIVKSFKKSYYHACKHIQVLAK